MSKNFYETNNFTIEEKFPNLGKNKEYKFLVGAEEFTVYIKNEPKNHYYPNFFADLIELQNHKYIHKMFGDVLYKYEEAETTLEEAKRRYGFLTQVYRAINNEKIMKMILDFAPKNSDGTLIRKNRIVIAADGIVAGSQAYITEIQGFAKNEHYLEIFIDQVSLREKEYKLIQDDFVSNHFDEMIKLI